VDVVRVTQIDETAGAGARPFAFPPTLIVPGWHDDARVLVACRDRLVEWGWPPEHVSCLSFRDRHGSNVEHAAEIGVAVAALAASSGQASVAVVAHSMGGLAVRHYLTTGQEPPVHTAIFVASPHRGTWAAWLAWGRGGAEMRPGSAFLRALNTRPLPAGIRAHCISTPIDTRVLPGSSARLPGSRCHRVWMPRHQVMLKHAGTLRLIRQLLLDRGDTPEDDSATSDEVTR
jgi:pimeloyl-ACP methyl ester carboxylesterase